MKKKYELTGGTKEFEVYYIVTGNATAIVKADTLEEATRLAEAFEVTDEELIEWSYDEVVSVKELK